MACDESGEELSTDPWQQIPKLNAAARGSYEPQRDRRRTLGKAHGFLQDPGSLLLKSCFLEAIQTGASECVFCDFGGAKNTERRSWLA